MARENEEGKISPAVLVPVAIAGLLGLGGIIYAFTREEEPPTIYTCPYCGAQFITEAELLAHIEAEHPGEPPPAEIVLSDLTIEPAEVYVNEPVTISVTATNIGDMAGSYEVTCEVNGEINKKTVTLNPGESKTVSFSLAAAATGTYQVAVDGLTGSFTVLLAPLVLSDLQVRSPVAVGKIFWVTVHAFNPNNVEITGTITMTSPWEDSIAITLGPGETRFINAFAISFDTPGEYLIRIDGLEATVVIMEILPAYVSNLKAAPEVVTVGGIVEITVDVSNPNWETTLVYLVQLTGAIQAEQEVTLAPHEVRTVSFLEIVTWEGYQTVYCDDLSVLIKGERVYDGEPPPGAYICPICGYEGDSNAEIGRHAAEVHYGYTYPAGTINAGSFAGMGGSLVMYDVIDPNPEYFAMAQWAMGNIVSGEYLWKNLSGDQKGALKTYLREDLGMTNDEIDALFDSYSPNSYWQRWIRISDIAPGWLKNGEPPPPRHKHFKSVPQEWGVPEGWYLVEGTEPFLIGDVWFISVWTWVYD